MSLRGYKKKGNPAPWLAAFPEQALRDLSAARRLLADAKKAAKRCAALKRARLRTLRKLNSQPKEAKAERVLKFYKSAAKRGRRQVRSAEYAAKARAFVAAAVARGETCPVVAAVPELRGGFRYGWPVSGKLNEVHHTRGRAGALLTDERFWVAVSKQGHRWIHAHPAEARRRGWLCEAGKWNTPEPVEADHVAAEVAPDSETGAAEAKKL